MHDGVSGIIDKLRLRRSTAHRGKNVRLNRCSEVPLTKDNRGMAQISCVRLTAEGKVEPAAFEYEGDRLTDRDFDEALLSKLRVDLFFSGTRPMPVRDLEGFQKVFVRQSDVVSEFIMLTLSLTGEGRVRMGFQKNEAGYELVSPQARLRIKLTCLLGPVVILKNPRFTVLKTGRPQDLSVAQFWACAGRLPDFRRLCVCERPRLEQFVPAPIQPGPARRPRAESQPGRARPKAEARIARTARKWEGLDVAVPGTFCSGPPGLIRMDTLERAARQTPKAGEAPDSDLRSPSPISTAASSVDTPPLEWTCDHVAGWLDSLGGCSRYIRQFQENLIDGRTLSSLTLEELKDDLGVKELGPRKAPGRNSLRAGHDAFVSQTQGWCSFHCQLCVQPHPKRIHAAGQRVPCLPPARQGHPSGNSATVPGVN
ncbi:unnamed protein product [Effrenium voratum]|uniref:SAM domain-containing protein n=1 Tax=Effrenium voratum TaxID=2562239 RepID=A0AA36J3J4_9DINO|nr:unnamed protein product [Effrenium voratum]